MPLHDGRSDAQPINRADLAHKAARGRSFQTLGLVPMTSRVQQYLPLGLWLLFAVGATLTLFILYKAGCAGDPKGGTLGSPVRALELESYSLMPMLLSVASGAIAVGLQSKSAHRAAQGGAFALLVIVCLWLAGMQIEIWGVQSCF